MAFVLTVMGWLGETVIKSLIDKVWDKMKEWGSQGGEGGECGVRDALINLEISLIKIQPIISKAENMWIRDENLRQNVNKLLVLLKDAAYDAEDMLDKFQFQKLQQQIKEQRNKASHPMKKRKAGEDNDHDFVNEIKKIQERLDSISIAMEKLMNSDNRGRMQIINEINRVTSSTPLETQVFGRDNELNELTRLLLEQDQVGSGSGSSSNISVITITGMGGVGKTTLAQEAYNDRRVEEYFKLRIWVCVSEDFSVERLTKEIIENATQQKCDPVNFDALQVVLKKKITSEKFLLVLDDVWNEDKCKWDSLYAPLRSGVTGSKILITTRNVKITNIVSSVNSIHLDGLDDDNSWAFFKKCAFGTQNSRDHPRLEAMAKEMIPKLKGLPLAARTLGGLLNMNMNEQQWKTIMESEIWKLPQEENGVLLVLQLCYQYLPAHLKRCFAFCSLYPKDYGFDKHALVRIWMAEGFFPAQKNIKMEDFGSGCFQELVSRSFFQKSQRENRYVMHDLLHDLAQLISEGETYRLEDGKKSEIPTMLRHLNIMSTKEDKELRRMMEFHDFNKLRTLIYSRQYGFMNSVLTCEFSSKLRSIRTLILMNCGLTEFPESISVFMHLRYLDISGNDKITELPDSLFKQYNLQALDFQNCDLYELPESIGDLIYLRYFDVSRNKILNKLPESLCRLSDLQTLDLYGCHQLRSLPQGMSRLINLRKLNAEDNLVSEITGIGKLTSLQSLSIFKVGKEHGQKLAELSGLTQLHGSLRITNLKNVESKEEAIAAKLQSKLHLDGLVLRWTNDQENDAFYDSDEEVLEYLQPSSTADQNNDAFSDSEEEVLEHLQPNSTTDQDNNAFSDSEEVLLEHLQPNSTTDHDNDAFSVSEEVLEHLQPNSMLKRLTISGYSGARSPSWLEAESFSRLKTLSLEDCKRWDDLSFIRKLSHLKNLVLKGLPAAKKIRQELYGSTESNWFHREWFPCLSVLEIYNCPLLKRLPLLPPSLTTLTLNQVGLTEFSGIQEGIGGSSSNIATVSPLVIKISKCPNLTCLDRIECFPCLGHLEINNCPLITELPGLQEGIGGSSSNIAAASLSVLRIRKCASLTILGRIEFSPCLTVVEIDNCPLLTRLPPLPASLVELKLIEVGLTELPKIGGSSSEITVSLSRLHIEECSNIISLEQGLLSYSLPKLETIFVTNCGELLRMPVKKFEEFTHLKSLSIVNCPKLMSMAQDDDIHHLLPPSIQRLELSNCGKFGKSLPGCLYNLTTLVRLELRDCGDFVSLPLEPVLHLEQLETLHLLNCSDLRSIEGVGILKSLKTLKIYGCPRIQPNEGDGQRENFFSLVKLHIDNTTLLKVSPLRNTLPSIKILKIKSSSEVNIFEGNDQNLLKSLTSLKYLKFHNCKNLQSLPTELHALSSLELLEITKCPQIRSLPEKGLPISLANLYFHDCHSTLEKQLTEIKRSGRFRPITGRIGSWRWSR